MKLAPENSVIPGFIEVLERPVEFLAQSDNNNIIWLDFNAVCNTSRSQNDYLELASRYQTVLLTSVYQLTDDKTDVVRRFINLIDVLYDCKVKLIICAECEVTSLYTGAGLKFEFARLISRIKEMQTARYLEIGHLM